MPGRNRASSFWTLVKLFFLVQNAFVVGHPPTLSLNTKSSFNEDLNLNLLHNPSTSSQSILTNSEVRVRSLEDLIEKPTSSYKLPSCYQQNEAGVTVEECHVTQSNGCMEKSPSVPADQLSSFVKVLFLKGRTAEDKRFLKAVESSYFLSSIEDPQIPDDNEKPRPVIHIAVIFLKPITFSFSVTILALPSKSPSLQSPVQSFQAFQNQTFQTSPQINSPDSGTLLESGEPLCWNAGFGNSEGWTKSIHIIKNIPLFDLNYTALVKEKKTNSVLSHSYLNEFSYQYSQLDFRELFRIAKSTAPKYEEETSTLSTLFPDRIDGKSSAEPRPYVSSLTSNRSNSSHFQDLKQMPSIRQKRDGCKCPALNELTPGHTYDPVTATLFLNASSEFCVEDCCQRCKVKVEIMKYKKAVDSQSCLLLESSPSVFKMIYPVSESDWLTINVPFEIKLPTGCYTAKLEIQDLQVFHGFFWVHPQTDLPDLNAWNTTFHLEPRPLSQEIEVRWTEPLHPFNFSQYSLQLWYQASERLNCTGHSNRDSAMQQVTPTPSLPLEEPRGVFYNLTPGWYCARVTPMDRRCPPDGCAVRTSHTIRLFDAKEFDPLVPSTSAPTGSPDQETVIAIIIGVVLSSAFLVLAAIYWLIRRRKSLRNREASTVVKVPLLNGSAKKDLQLPPLLVAWTALSDAEGRVRSAVDQLKKILANYFTVIDYLDLLSLDPPQRDKLLQNPAAWLYSTVLKSEAKVVLVSSAGAGEWQKAVQAGAGTPEDVEDCTPLDRTLFPYLLQIVLHNIELVANYSKIFVIRLGDIDTPLTLEGISPGLVYSLPLHLQQLLSALTREQSSEANLAEEDLIELSRKCGISSSSV